VYFVENYDDSSDFAAIPEPPDRMNQLYLQRLRTTLEKIAWLEPADWSSYEHHIEKIEFGKKQYLLRAGQVENHVYFVLTGAVRLFFQKDDREICVDFGFEGQLISSYLSFLTREPSLLNVQALTPIFALRLHHRHVQQLFGASKENERFGRTVAERIYVAKLKREMMLLSQSAEEKYRHLLHKHPTIIQQVPVKDIASYLGIHPESLSRIRKQVREFS
jgi:CRP-like cAMP-binding protein